MKPILVTFFSLSAFLGIAQIQVHDLPRSGFDKRIRNHISQMRIVDSHEHLREQVAVKGNVSLDFMLLLHHYAGSDLQSAGLSASQFEDLVTDKYTIEQKWAIVKPYWRSTRNTAYCRSVITSIKALFGLEDLNDDTYKEISRMIKEAHDNPNWYDEILRRRARIDLAVQDVRSLRSASNLFVNVERFDDFVNIRNNRDLSRQASKVGFAIGHLDDLINGLIAEFDRALQNRMVGLKIGLAYHRILYFEKVERDLAMRIFDKISTAAPETQMSFEEVKPLQDYMMHQVLSLARQYELPVQIHTGLQAGNGNIITNSNPTHLANLFLEYRDIKFCLFHGGYPYGGELATLAKNFPNVYIDMCWTQIISPSYSIRYLHEWLETVPANKIMAFGGDYQYAENVYAHSIMAKEVVTEVLVEKVATGYLRENEAIEIADMLLYENALELFKPR